MLTLNFFQTFFSELSSFLYDFKKEFIKISASIHHFLNRYFSDTALLVFAIAIGAILLILIFQSIINKK